MKSGGSADINHFLTHLKEYEEYYRKMIDTYEKLTGEEKEDLHLWEQDHLVGGGLAFADWPGWESYIGLPPWRVKAE